MKRKSFRIPNDSKLPMITALCAVVMLIFTFFNVAIVDGDFQWSLTEPFIGYFTVVSCLYTLLKIASAGLFLYLSIAQAKKNITLLTIPSVVYLGYIIFVVFTNVIFAQNWYVLDSQYFKFIAFLIITILFALTCLGNIKSKMPMLIASAILMGISFIMLLAHIYPFGSQYYNGINIYYISHFGFYVAFILGYMVLTIAMEEVELDETEIEIQQMFSNRTEIPTELLEVKNIAVCIILEFVTCGIYGLFWRYQLCKKIKLLSGEGANCTGEFLCLTFVPFYGLYWLYTRGQKLSASAGKWGIQVNENGILYLILALVGLGIVSFAMMQNDLNKIAGKLGTDDKPMGEQPVPAYGTNQGTPLRTNTATKDAIEAIKQLAELKENGIISEEEFEEKKAKLLEQI